MGKVWPEKSRNYFGAGLLATRLPRPLVAALTAASTLGLLFLTFRFTHGYWVG